MIYEGTEITFFFFHSSFILTRDTQLSDCLIIVDVDRCKCVCVHLVRSHHPYIFFFHSFCSAFAHFWYHKWNLENSLLSFDTRNEVKFEYFFSSVAIVANFIIERCHRHPFFFSLSLPFFFVYNPQCDRTASVRNANEKHHKRKNENCNRRIVDKVVFIQWNFSF